MRGFTVGQFEDTRAGFCFTRILKNGQANIGLPETATSLVEPNRAEVLRKLKEEYQDICWEYNNGIRK